MTLVAPHSPEAEDSLLGALLLSADTTSELLTYVTADDFYRPGNGHVFAAVSRLHGTGSQVDAVTVADELQRGDVLDLAGGPSRLVELQARCPSRTNAPRYAEIVVRAALLRRIASVCAEGQGAALEPGADPADLVDVVSSQLGQVAIPLDVPPKDLRLFGPWVLEDRPVVPWVLPHLLGRQHRCLLVAPEGLVKSSLTRQIGMLAAQGLHPFTLRPMPPIRVLLCDFENPEDYLRHYSAPIVQELRRRFGDAYDDDRTWIWHRGNGANLRTRKARGEFEAAIAACRPDLVIMGPLYKMYRRTGRENDEDAALEVTAILDDLRTRYDFALIIEHHAAKAVSGGERVMDPFGSSVWMRWPDYGLGLRSAKKPEGSMSISHSRGARLPAAWPNRLDIAQGVPWRWSAYWSGSMPDEGEPREATF